MKIWFVGKPIVVDGEELGWMPEGAFETEEEAAKVATDAEFIVLAEVGGRFPEKATDAEKLYYPKLERWEDSALYKMRNQ
ncbi:MAG: hypothetical protein AB7D06_08805 [Pedobacter sp.]